MVCSLKNMVTGQLTAAQSTSKSKPKKKASHLSNSHYAVNHNSNMASGQTITSDSAKQIQQIPKSQIKSIRHHQTLTSAIHSSSHKQHPNIPASRTSITGMTGESSNKKSSYNPLVQPLPTQKAKKLQIQMQFAAGQKTSTSTHVTPANNITRPSTATQISYLNQRSAQPISHSTHTSPQHVLSSMAFKQVPMPLGKKANDQGKQQD